MSAALNFAVNCDTYGIGTPQCPEASLRWWANYTLTRSKALYDARYVPLLAKLDPVPVAETSPVAPEAGLRWYANAVLASEDQPRRTVRLHL